MTKNKGPSITMEGYLTCLLAYIHTQTYIHICLQSTCLDACLGAYETTSQSTYLPTYPQMWKREDRNVLYCRPFPTASPSSVPAALHQKVRPAWFAKLRFAMRIAELWLWKTSIKIQCPDNPHKPLYYKACWKPNNLRALWAQRSQ